MIDILAAIDAAINTETGYVCGYAPCGKRLDPNGPSRDYCSEDHQAQYLALQNGPDPEVSLTTVMRDLLRQELHLLTVDEPLYAIVPEADTRAFLGRELMATGHQVIASDEGIDLGLYYLTISHCILTIDGPPQVCACDRTTLFVESGDYGMTVPMPGHGATAIEIAKVIRGMNLHPSDVFDTYQRYYPDN